MSTPLETLQAEVMRLSAADRARLLDRLVASLDVDTTMEHAWDGVAEQREQQLLAGDVQAIPLDQALARIESKLAG